MSSGTTTPKPTEFRASHRYAGMADRKARRVADLIRGRSVNQALADLEHDRHRAAPALRKVLASAVANALQNPEVRASRLVVSQVYVNGGPLLQGRMRFRPGPMGRAMPFRRRTCHIHVSVADPEVIAAPPAQAAPAAEAETATETTEEPAKKATAKKATKKAAAKKTTKKAAAKKKTAKKKATKKDADKPASEDKD